LNEAVAARVDDWPTSTVVGLTEMVGDERAAFTVTVTALDVTVTGELELSLTCSSKDQDPTVVKIPVDADPGDVHGVELPKLV
jgi:hypothetical protein